MSRRVRRIEVELPDLPPAQANLLWSLFDELTWKIWEAYEPEILDFEAERFGSQLHRQTDPAPDLTSAHPSAPEQPLSDGDSEPDF